MPLKVTAVGQSRRFRGGQQFSNVPRVIDESELSQEQLDAIRDDPVLHVVETDEAVSDAVLLDPLTADEIEEKIREAISSLGEDDYTQMGQPRMPAFREALSNIESGEEIEADQLRMLQSFERMKRDDGFKPPVLEPSDPVKE